jgi:cell wall-associated NlpC family hydrolase
VRARLQSRSSVGRASVGEASIGRARDAWRRRLLPALVALVAVTALGGAPALATPVPDPGQDSEELRAQVAALTAEVERLEVQAEIAIEASNEVSAELDALIARELAAQVELDDAGRALDDDRAAATRRVRALYRSGGTVEIAWTALSGSGFADAATTYRTARVVLAADAEAVERSREQVEVAVTSSAEVQDLRRERAALEVEADARREAAEAALQERETLLLSTDAALVAAVERERQAAEAAALAWTLAQAQAAAQSQAARAAAGEAGLGWALTGPGGGSVPAGFVGPSLDQQAVVERAAAAAPTPTAAAAIRAAATRLGAPYVWGATGPGTFDCSGLTMWAYRQAGVNNPRTSRQQYAGLPRVDVSALLPGDLVFYADGPDPGSIHHVSIYLGDGLILTAPRTGDVVKISPVWRTPVYGAVRPAG